MLKKQDGILNTLIIEKKPIDVNLVNLINSTFCFSFLFFAALIFFFLFFSAVMVYAQTETFNTSGNYTVPSGVTQVTIQAWGAGGGGSSNSDRAGGGGGGAFAYAVVSVTPDSTYTVTVGTGGAVGSGGGTSSFGNLVIAVGGSSSTNENGGAGGADASCTGDVAYSGGDGGNGRNNGGGGGGGGSAFTDSDGGDGSNGGNNAGGSGGSGTGDGGRGGDEDGTPAAETGNVPGGGGGGRGDDAGSSAAGANGRVIVTAGSVPLYCTSNGNMDYNTSVTLVNFNTISNSSGKTSAYYDYTSISTNLTLGSSYNLTVNVNTDGNYIVYAYAWIDWNQDGDFTDTGEGYDLGSATNTSDGATSGCPYSILVPVSATFGSTRMRVSAKFNSSPGSCETGFDGEVEDYSLNIQDVSSPTLVVDPDNLAFGYVAYGNTSSPMSFTVAGLGLTGYPGNITISAPSCFEVSFSSGSGYSSSINLPFSSSILSETTIYVHFTPDADDTNYSGNITLSGGGDTEYVAVTGTSSPYCQSYGNTNYNTSITRVIFNTIDNISGKPSGYSDYTSVSTIVGTSSSYNLTVYVNTDGNYTVHVLAWIDWDQNADFTDSGEEYDLGTATNTSNGTTSSSPLSVSVPSGATIGNTRMRISVRYNQDPGSCSTSFDGEVEDYLVNVQNLPIVSGFDPTAACYGSDSTVTITGNNFSGTTNVSFNSISASFTVNSSTEIEATLPATATTGTISVTNGAGTGYSSSSFTVYSLPNNTYTMDDATICHFSSASLTLSGSESGVDYQLRDDSDDSNVGSPVTGTGSSISFNNLSPDDTTTYNVFATNTTTGCEVEMSDLATIFVLFFNAESWNITGLTGSDSINLEPASRPDICPELIPPDFNPDDSDYDCGASCIDFRVDRDSSYANWQFDFTLTGATVLDTTATGDVSTPSLSGTTPLVDAGDNNKVYLRFKIDNVTETVLNITFNVENVQDTDYSCNETGNFTDNDAYQTINQMPVIGSFE